MTDERPNRRVYPEATLSYVTQVRLTERQRRYLVLVREASPGFTVSMLIRQLVDDAIDGALEAAEARGADDLAQLRLVLDGADLVVGSDVAEHLSVPAHTDSRSRS
jgi:hypothetical protein